MKRYNIHLSFGMVYHSDNYHFNYRIVNSTGLAQKKVSAMNFYCYRFMTRDGDDHILRFRQLLNQFVVDTFAKIKGKRLLYIRLNQKKKKKTKS